MCRKRPGAYVPKAHWLLYAENALAPLCRKRNGAYVPEDDSRSLQDLVVFLAEIRALGIDLYLHRQGLATATPSGRAPFDMLSVFAKFERELIAERVRAGMHRAKAAGKRLGRPPLSAEVVARIRAQRAKGVGVVKTARTVRCGASAVRRVST